VTRLANPCVLSETRTEATGILLVRPGDQESGAAVATLNRWSEEAVELCCARLTTATSWCCATGALRIASS